MKKNFSILNGHWPYGPSRAMWRCARGLDLGQDLGGLVELADLTAPVRYGPGVAPPASTGPSLSGAVCVPPMPDGVDFHGVLVLVDAVDDPVGPASC